MECDAVEIVTDIRQHPRQCLYRRQAVCAQIIRVRRAFSHRDYNDVISV